MLTTFLIILWLNLIHDSLLIYGDLKQKDELSSTLQCARCMISWCWQRHLHRHQRWWEGWDGVLTLIPFATNSATTSFWPLFTQHWLRYKRPLLIENLAKVGFLWQPSGLEIWIKLNAISEIWNTIPGLISVAAQWLVGDERRGVRPGERSLSSNLWFSSFSLG